MSQEKTDKVKKPFYKKFWFIFLCIVVLVIIIAVSSSSSDENTPNDVTSKPDQSVEVAEEVKTPLVVTVDEMIDALDNNALKATKTYKDQYVELTGRLGNIDSDGKYFTLDLLSGEISFDSVSCRIQEKHLDQVMEFSENQEVTVTGTVVSVGDIMGYTLKVDTIK